MNTHSPQSGHNDPQNYPTIKTENTIDVTGNGNKAENEDVNDAENEDKNEQEDLDEDENEHEDLEEAPTNNYSADTEPNNATDPGIISTTMDKQYGARKQTGMWARKQKSDLPPKLCIHPTIKSKRSKSCTPMSWYKPWATLTSTSGTMSGYTQLSTVGQTNMTT